MKLKSVYRNFGLEHVSGAVDKREAVGSRVVGAPTGGSYPGRGAARHSRAPSRLCYRPWRASGHRCHMGCGVWRPGSVPRPRSQVPPGSAVRDRRAGRPPAPAPRRAPPPAGAGTARRTDRPGRGWSRRQKRAHFFCSKTFHSRVMLLGTDTLGPQRMSEAPLCRVMNSLRGCLLQQQGGAGSGRQTRAGRA